MLRTREEQGAPLAQDQSTSRIVAGVFTAVGLGLLWLVVAVSLPSESDLSAKESTINEHLLSTAATTPGSETTLDLSVPGVLPPPPGESPSSENRMRDTSLTAPRTRPTEADLRSVQVARLRCEAEFEQLCPGAAEGPARMRCLEQRAQHVGAPCQPQLHARFLRWKEGQKRMLRACQEDAKRWCGSVEAGNGGLVQCLEERAQDVSDRCYETFPKGTVSFRQ